MRSTLRSWKSNSSATGTCWSWTLVIEFVTQKMNIRTSSRNFLNLIKLRGGFVSKSAESGRTQRQRREIWQPGASAKRVAPGYLASIKDSTESAKYHRDYYALSELQGRLRVDPGATRLAPLGACPWLSYFAPLALHRLIPPFLCKAS